MKSFNLKKLITITSLVCVGISALLGILLLIKLVPTNATIGKIYLTLLTIFISGIFLLNAIDALNRKNVFGYITAVLICLSAVLFLVCIWGGITGFFLKLTVWFAMASILLDMIVSNVLALGNAYLFLQIPEYLLLSYIEIAIGLLISTGSTALIDVWQVFAICIILFLALLITLNILVKSKRGKKTEEVKRDTVTISREEYEGLLNKIKELESKLNK